MSTQVDILEAIGYGPDDESVASAINLLGLDAHSDIVATIRRDPTGRPVYSYERWLRMRFQQTEGSVGNIRFWIDNLAPGSGWSLLYGVTALYRKPVNTASVIAVEPVPTIDPGGAAANVLRGFTSTYSPWIVLQACWSASGDAPMQIDALDYRFAWDEP